MSQNHSGFVGYPAASIYPDMGDRVSQTMATAVDPEEQSSLSAQEPDRLVTTPVSSKTKSQTWMVFGALAVLIVIFGIPTTAK